MQNDCIWDVVNIFFFLVATSCISWATPSPLCADAKFQIGLGSLSPIVVTQIILGVSQVAQERSSEILWTAYYISYISSINIIVPEIILMSVP